MSTVGRWALALVAAFVLGWLGSYGFTRRSADRALQENAVHTAKVDTVHIEAKLRTDTVTQTVTRLVDRWRTDTLWRADTITVRDTLRVLVPAPTLAAMDSTIRACRVLVDRAGAERTACEAAIAARDARIRILERKPWRARLDCNLGYGVVVSRGEIAHGPGALCGWSLW